MRFEFVIYPEAQRRLEESGLTKRIKEAVDKNKVGVSPSVFESDVVANFKYMKDHKYFERIPKEDKEDMQAALNKAWKGRDEAVWKVGYPSGEYLEPVEHEDFLMFIGNPAIGVLKKAEFFDYKKFGFEGPTEFMGTLSAAIQNALHRDTYREGYCWRTTHSDGITVRNQITGDMHCDMKIFQTDLTPHETISPLGKRVLYRPETSKDRGGLYAYHSTEPAMLLAVLKWADEFQHLPESLKDGAKDTIAWAKTLGQGGGTCAEHFGGFERNVRILFGGYDFPMPRLSKEGASGHTFIHIGTSGDSAYAGYLGEKGELLFRHESWKDGKMSAGDVCARFIPSEADHLVKGLLYQCARGLGRTSAKELIGMLEYRFSEQFESDMAESRKTHQPR